MSYFTKATVKFFRDLAKNNNKEWFEKNRPVFNEVVMEPAKNFVIALGEKLRDDVPDIKAIPKTDKSIFRLHRDTRFSNNKEPYKTNLGIYLWEGERKKMESSGFYFHIEPKLFFLGVGAYMFEKDLLKLYRHAIDRETTAKELDDIVKKLKRSGYNPGGLHYKKIPRGFTADHKYSEYILYNGFYVGTESKDIKELIESKDQVNFAYKHFQKMVPVHNWLMENVY